ncbi:MAG: aldose 1-epimerase family protein, partial [Algoriphagus sp.]
MKYTIQSTELSVEVNSTGLELSSIKSTQTGQEYLWQGDPAIWGGQAPVLFPIVGGLKEGFTLIEGLKYQMPKHGIVRNCDKTKLLQQTDSSLWFRLSSDQETLASYPYQFQLDMIFTLAAKTLTIEHHISNLGTQTMYYSLGAHPAFNCPMLAGEVYEDYLLEFAEAEIAHTQLVDPSGLIGLDQKLVLDNTNVLQLHGQLFDGDALIF